MCWCSPKIYLTLAQRISIAVGIADAMAYLHNDCGRPIIHCDLKPTNILLDDDMNAHLGDFGISRLLRDFPFTTLGHSGSNGSVIVKGTIGYIPPGKIIATSCTCERLPFYVHEYLNFTESII